MRLAPALLILLFASHAAAQSVNPPIAIYDGSAGRARGSIVVDNPTLYPLNYVLEPKRFIVACGGDVAFGPIDTTHLRVRLSSMSGRLAARQHATIFYEANADSLPAWFAIVVGFFPGRTEPGLNVRIEIPHIVYLMQHDRVTNADVAISRAIYSSEDRYLHIRVENKSRKLTRISELVGVSATGKEHSIDACPVFPESAREFTYLWPEATPPAKIIVRFPGFSIEAPVTIAPLLRARPMP